MMCILASSWVFAQNNEEQKNLPKGEVYTNKIINVQQLYTTKSNISKLTIKKNDRSDYLFTTGAYKNNTVYSQQCNPVNLPELTNSAERINLHISEKFELESYQDEGKILISDDNQKSWHILSVRSGKSTNRIQIVDLTAYAGKKVVIAFELKSDESYNYGGWTVFSAEVKLEELNKASIKSATTGLKSTTTSGFSGTFTGIDDTNFGGTESVIRLFCEVSNNGQPVSNLDSTNFTITEKVDSIWTIDPKWPKDSLHEEYRDDKNDINFEVTTPTNTAQDKYVDIVFLMDNSGSMQDEQAAISKNVKSFLDSLKVSNIKARIGLCRFGQGTNNGAPIIVKNNVGSWWSNYAGPNNPYDIDDFISSWDSVNDISGSIEVSYDAMYESASSGDFNFSATAQRIFIHITDEAMAGQNAQNSKVTDVQVVISEMKSKSIAVYALCPDNTTFRNEFGTISNATGGKFYNITSPFNTILNDISTNVSSKYEIVYSATRNIYDGLPRQVEIEVNSNQGNTKLTGKSYTPGATPFVSQTDSTWNTYHASAVPYPEKMDAPISVNVIDYYAPFAHNTGGYVKLLYRAAGTTLAFNEISMSNTSITRDTAIWVATIPGTQVLRPGIEYYVQAFDGQSSNVSPNFPLDYRWTFAVWPNFKPVIADSTAYVNPVTASQDSIEKTGYNVNDVIDFRVMASDNTTKVSSVEVYFQVNSSNFVAKPMTLIKDSIYGYTIKLNSKMGITNYFFVATDDHGVASYLGSENKPYRIDTRKNTQARHTINLSGGRPPFIWKTKIKVLDQLLSDGDSIKIFYKDKTKLKQSASACYKTNGIGSIVLKDNDVFINGKNGFYLGDEIIFKIWQKSSGRLYDAVSYPSNILFADKASTNIDSIIVHGQTIGVQSGSDFLWSTTADMSDYSFNSVLKYVSSSIALIRDNENNEWRPNAANNTLNQYVRGYGYKVTLASGVSSLNILTIGKQRDFTKDSLLIPVYTNTPAYSIIGCPYASAESIDNIVNGADISSVTKKEGAVTYTYYPGYLSYSSWTTDLNMYPGHAYYMDANNANHYFTFPAPKGMATKLITKAGSVKSLDQIVSDDNEYMHLILPENSWDIAPKNGNIVKAYNTFGDVIGKNTVFNNGTSMLIDGTSLNKGDLFELRYTDVENGEERTIKVNNWAKGNDQYASHKMAVAGNLKVSTLAIEEKSVSEINSVTVFPNPVRDNLTVSLVFTKDVSASIVLKTASGKDILQLSTEKYLQGNHTVNIPLSNLPKGIYFLSVITEAGSRSTQKVIIN